MNARLASRQLIWRFAIAAFCGNAAEFDECGKILRLRGENFLHEELKFLGAFIVALSFNFLGEFVNGDQIVLVQLD